MGHTPVTIHNPGRVDTWQKDESSRFGKSSVLLHLPNQDRVEFADGIVPAPYAEMVRAGQVESIELFLM